LVVASQASGAADENAQVIRFVPERLHWKKGEANE
jgi:hypothetical protein